jgi:hypothetical protein
VALPRAPWRSGHQQRRDPHNRVRAPRREKDGDMATASDYVVYTDSTFTLPEGNDTDKTFKQTIDGEPVGSQGGVLSWKVQRLGTGPLKYELFVNGDVQADYKLEDSDSHSIQEVIPSDKLHKGDNMVRFHLVEGPGKLMVGDVTLTYRKRL